MNKIEEMEIIMLEYYRARLENDTDKQAEAVKKLLTLIQESKKEAELKGGKDFAVWLDWQDVLFRGETEKLYKEYLDSSHTEVLK